MFCKAVNTQNTYDFNHCITSMLKYFGGSPKTILRDNLKTGVSRQIDMSPFLQSYVTNWVIIIERVSAQPALVNPEIKLW